jgi:hypothetical protein
MSSHLVVLFLYARGINLIHWPIRGDVKVHPKTHPRALVLYVSGWHLWEFIALVPNERDLSGSLR